ncbi:glycosyltransferase family 2 protein [Cuniculiplasma sp. SKW4]|uniref:glycosyltransferase family 2 protein n=1 Tax=Cuniculiplasma sp. SKW4 TaxID=3400171 RepID=UPI003FCF7866
MKSSVIIPVHYRKDFVTRAVKSVREGSDSTEILVVKNYSDENIDRIIESMNAVNILEHADPLGTKIARGLSEASGDVIFILEDDDYFEKDKINHVMKLFEKKGIDYHHNDMIKVNAKGETIGKGLKGKSSKNSLFIDKIDSQTLDQMHRYKMYYNTSSMAFRKDILMDYTDQMKRVGLVMDTFLFQISLLNGKYFFQDNQTLTNYTVHESASNISGVNFEDFISRGLKFFNQAYQDSLISASLLKDSNLSDYAISWSNFLKNSINLFTLGIEKFEFVDLPQGYDWVPFGATLNKLIKYALKSPEVIRRGILKTMYISEYKIKKR